MGFRFRRVLRLGKLARINVGTKGASLSLGPPGAVVNFGSRGARMTVGVPGTGMSHGVRLAGAYTRPSSSGSSSGGCLKALGILYLLALAAAAVGGAARASPVGGVVTAALIVAIWISTSRWLRRRREARARAVADAIAAEEERARNDRWAYLLHRYTEPNAHKIWRGQLWLGGCTTDMAMEILGAPAAVDEKVLKTKVKRTLKYYPTGANRYALRVFVEDGEVVGWEDKSD